MQGEFWLQDGHAVFADGDVGDMGHEAFVIDAMARDIIQTLDGSELGDLIDKILEEEGMTLRKMEYDERPDFDLVAKALDQIADDRGESVEHLLEVNQPGIPKEWYEVATGQADVRQWGIEHFGWTRVRDRSVETWELTPSKFKEIADGLYDAYGDELGEGDTSSDDEVTFEIEDRKTGRFYTEVPWSVIVKEDYSSLMQYQSRYGSSMGKRIVSAMGAFLSGGVFSFPMAWRFPVEDRLDEAFPGKGRLLRKVLSGKLPYRDYGSVKELREGSPRVSSLQQMMVAANEILHGRGIKSLEGRAAHPIAFYIDLGNKPTLIFDKVAKRVHVITPEQFVSMFGDRYGVTL